MSAVVYPLRFLGIHLDYFVMKVWVKTTLWLYQIKVVKLGENSKIPAIIVTNHISYWDILTITASYKTFFVSKDSVKH